MSDPTDRLRELIDASTQGERTADPYRGESYFTARVARADGCDLLIKTHTRADRDLIAVLTSTDVARAVVGMLAATQLPLLFHAGGPFDRTEWTNALARVGSGAYYEPTTRGMCDAIRDAQAAFDATVLAALERIDHDPR